MDIVLIPLLRVLYIALDLYWYVVLATIIHSWLLTFGIVNAYNQTVRTIGNVLVRLTEPVLRPIRQALPDFGGLDISPIVLGLIIIFLKLMDESLIEKLHGF